MSLVLLLVTGLFLRSLQSAANIDIGFRPQGLLLLSVDPRLNGYSPQQISQFLAALRRRVAALPGVDSAVRPTLRFSPEEIAVTVSRLRVMPVRTLPSQMRNST